MLADHASCAHTGGCALYCCAAVCRPGWWRNALVGLETVGSRTSIAQANWALTDAKGYALRSENETGGCM